MDSLLLLLPLSLVLLLAALLAFRWAVRSGQFNDLERHGEDILYPDSNQPQRSSPPDNPSREQP